VSIAEVREVPAALGGPFVENFRFRLQLDSLEDRSVPSVTPSQVLFSMYDQGQVAGEVHGVVEHLNDPQTKEALAFLPGHLQFLADSSHADFQVLSEYLHELQTAPAPGTTPATLNLAMAQTAAAELQAHVNEVYAQFYALAYGEPPRVPPPPPPGVDNGPGFGNSSLPFSLSDPNFQTIANGVRIWDVTPGTGTALATGNQFTASYTGFLTNGTVFDSSAKSGNLSTTLDSSHLIPGFAEGLVGMKPGGTRRIDIPASQAYGANPPAGSGIPPNSELVFEVHLISSP
jgi:FKBP-type peptidyl-prolyl cis-trans isomerase FkpA